MSQVMAVPAAMGGYLYYVGNYRLKPSYREAVRHIRLRWPDGTITVESIWWQKRLDITQYYVEDAGFYKEINGLRMWFPLQLFNERAAVLCLSYKENP